MKFEKRNFDLLERFFGRKFKENYQKLWLERTNLIMKLLSRGRTRDEHFDVRCRDNTLVLKQSVSGVTKVEQEHLSRDYQNTFIT